MAAAATASRARRLNRGSRRAGWQRCRGRSATRWSLEVGMRPTRRDIDGAQPARRAARAATLAGARMPLRVRRPPGQLMRSPPGPPERPIRLHEVARRARRLDSVGHAEPGSPLGITGPLDSLSARTAARPDGAVRPARPHLAPRLQRLRLVRLHRARSLALFLSASRPTVTGSTRIRPKEPKRA